MPKFLIFLFLFYSNLVVAQQKYTLSGFVVEKDSEEKLPGAIIKVNASSTFINSNEYGFYSISLPQGNYMLRVAFPGAVDSLYQINLSQDLSLNLEIRTVNELEGVEVSAVSKNVEQIRMGSHNLDLEKIKDVPTLLGEKDVFKVLKLLPGVQKGQEGSSGFNVRGGGVDQNLIILDDAVVYNASHLFGFFSTFNGDALKGVELIKGGYPAKYGGRLSSVLNLTMKEGNKQEIKGEYGIGLLSSRLMLEGPIIKSKASFIVSARRSYADFILSPIIRLWDKNIWTGYYFYDLNAKLNYKIDDKNDIFLSGYFGRDRYYLREKQIGSFYKSHFGWGNATGTLRWNHIFNPKLFSNVTVNYSNYKMQVDNSEKSDNDFYSLKYISQIDDIGAKTDLTYYWNNNNTLRFGYKFTRHFFKPNAIVGKDSLGKNNVNYKTYKSFENNVYIDDEWKFSDKIAANFGARATSFSSEGKTYFNVEPRISTRFLVYSSSSVKASYTVMNQYMHLLTSTGIGLPTDLWVPATERIKPQTATQYSLGLFKDFSKPNLSFSLEGYYKEMKNVIAYKEGASFMTIDDPTSPEIKHVPFEDNVTSGIGKSYGAEFMVQKPKGKLNGWLSYTLSWTQYKMAEINEGNWYYPQFDRRHDLSVVGFYQLTPKIKINALFTMATGNPIYLPIYDVSYVIDPSPNGSIQGHYQTKQITKYNKRNEFRAETYHRMDVGIQFLKQKKRGLRTWEISFYNVYNRKNPFYYNIETNFSNGTADAKLYKYTIFPFIPSITYSFKF